MDGMDEVTWHDDPEEHDNDDDEAENLHSIIEDVNNREVDPEEIKTEISVMRQRLERDVSASEAFEVEVVVDRQQQDDSNEVIHGDIQELTDAVNRLREVIQAQPEGPLGISARNWQRVKYLAAGGLAIYAFTSDTFQIISFLQAAATGSVFLQTIEALYDTDDPATKNRQAVIKWVNQDEDSFWKSQAAYYVPKTKYSLTAQINNAQMMMYVAGGSSKLNSVIRWDAAEKLAVVQGLSKTYLNKGSRAMYLSVTSYKIEGKPLPRVVALGCVSLALALVIEHLQAKSGTTLLLRSDVAGTTREATDRPAKHFEPIFVFQKVLDPDLDVRDYARLITKTWNATMHISQKDEPTRDLFLHNPPKQIINDELKMENSSKVLSKIPDTTVRRKLQQVIDRFLAMCSTTYPLLPGETITEHHLAMLTAPYRYAVPGAIAYARTTNYADTIFIAHQVRFDVSTGHPALVYRQTTQVSQPLIAKTVRFNKLYMNEADFFKTYIGPVAQTLAFGMPPPWGVVGAAGVQILDEIFGAFGSGPNLALVIKNLLEETVQAMKNLLLDDAVRLATNSINAFIEWVSIATTGLDNLTSDNEIWINQTLDTLGDVNNPSFTGNILSDLITLTSPELCTIQRDEVISLAFMAASSLFFSYRLRCQLYSLLASFAQSKNKIDEYDLNAGEFYILSTEFQVTLETWIGTLNKKLDELVKSRKDCVTQVQYYDNRSTQCHSQGGPAGGTSCDVTGQDGYDCEDTFLGTIAAMIPNNRWSSGCCHQNDHCETFVDQVNAARNTYLADLDKALLVKYADHRKTIDEWNASLGKVKAMMPPKQPAAPTISTWLKQTPDPDLQGKQVQYLVEFVNINGPSTISPGSGFVAILTGKAPQVFIPTDPDGAATKRNIYRQLIDSSGTTQNREKVDILNNNTTQVWVDGANTLKRGFLKHPQPQVPKSQYRSSRL